MSWDVLSVEKDWIYLSDAKQVRKVRAEDIESVMHYDNWSQFNMAYDFEPCENWFHAVKLQPQQK